MAIYVLMSCKHEEIQCNGISLLCVCISQQTKWSEKGTDGTWLKCTGEEDQGETKVQFKTTQDKYAIQDISSLFQQSVATASYTGSYTFHALVGE